MKRKEGFVLGIFSPIDSVVAVCVTLSLTNTTFPLQFCSKIQLSFKLLSFWHLPEAVCPATLCSPLLSQTLEIFFCLRISGYLCEML